MNPEYSFNIHLVQQNSHAVCLYSGENNYLIPADFCPFKKKKKRVYHFYGRFIWTETEYQTTNPEKSSIQMLKKDLHFSKSNEYLIPTNQQEFWLPQIGYVHMWNTDQSCHFKKILLISARCVYKRLLSIESVSSIPTSPLPWAKPKSCQRTSGTRL